MILSPQPNMQTSVHVIDERVRGGEAWGMICYSPARCWLLPLGEGMRLLICQGLGQGQCVVSPHSRAAPKKWCAEIVHGSQMTGATSNTNLLKLKIQYLVCCINQLFTFIKGQRSGTVLFSQLLFKLARSEGRFHAPCMGSVWGKITITRNVFLQVAMCRSDPL